MKIEYLADEIKELKEQILIDQARWLEETMSKLLSREECEKLKGDSIGDEEKSRILKSHGLFLQHIPDVMGMRILQHGKVVADFKVQFTDEQDGRKIYTLEPDTTDVEDGAFIPKREGSQRLDP